jgi:hypothetical protein
MSLIYNLHLSSNYDKPYEQYLSTTYSREQ